MKRVTRKIDSFKVISDSKKLFTIDVYQDFVIDTQFGKDAPDEIPINKSYITSAGKRVNMVDENTFDILADIEMIRVKRI